MASINNILAVPHTRNHTEDTNKLWVIVSC